MSKFLFAEETPLYTKLSDYAHSIGWKIEVVSGLTRLGVAASVKDKVINLDADEVNAELRDIMLAHELGHALTTPLFDLELAKRISVLTGVRCDLGKEEQAWSAARALIVGILHDKVPASFDSLYRRAIKTHYIFTLGRIYEHYRVSNSSVYPHSYKLHQYQEAFDMPVKKLHRYARFVVLQDLEKIWDIRKIEEHPLLKDL